MRVDEFANALGAPVNDILFILNAGGKKYSVDSQVSEEEVITKFMELSGESKTKNDNTLNAENMPRRWNEGPKTVRIGSKYLDVTDNYNRHVDEYASAFVKTPDLIFNKEKAMNDKKEGLAIAEECAQDDYKIDPRNIFLDLMTEDVVFMNSYSIPGKATLHPNIYGDNILLQDFVKYDFSRIERILGAIAKCRCDDLLMKIYHKTYRELTDKEKEDFKKLFFYFYWLGLNIQYNYDVEPIHTCWHTMESSGKSINVFMPAMIRYLAVYDYFGTEKKRFNIHYNHLVFLCKCVTKEVFDYINKVDYNALNGGRFEEYFRNMPEDILPDFLKGITKNKEFVCEEYIKRVITPFVTKEDLDNMYEMFNVEKSWDVYSKSKYKLANLTLDPNYESIEHEELQKTLNYLDSEDVLAKYEYSFAFQHRILDEGYDGIGIERYNEVLDSHGEKEFTQKELYLLGRSSTTECLIKDGTAAINKMTKMLELGTDIPLTWDEINDSVAKNNELKDGKPKKKGLFGIFNKSKDNHKNTELEPVSEPKIQEPPKTIKNNESDGSEVNKKETEGKSISIPSFLTASRR